MVSTQQFEYVYGPAEKAFSRQTGSGHVPCNTLFSPLDEKSALIRTATLDPLLVDYNFDFIQIIYQYWLRSGNDTFLETYWPNMAANIGYALSRALDPMTQLFGAINGDPPLPLSGFKGQALGPANTVSMILSLERMADIADHLGYNSSASRYRIQAGLSRAAIDALLWNKTGGYYSMSVGTAGYDTISIAQVLLAQIGAPARRTIFTEKLASLKLPAGYSNGTSDVDTPLVVNPYYMSFLLEGLAIVNETNLAQGLLDALYTPMVRRDRNYTGAYWEYVSYDGTYPGLDLFTGQSHFWGSYGTTFLTEYALDIRPTAPAYSQFLFAPLSGFETEWVQGRVPTPNGNIMAAWGFNSKRKVIMEIDPPAGASGVIVPPFTGSYSMGGQSGLFGNLSVTGGRGAVTIAQD